MKIAISGTIGSGKSEFCNYLRQKGYDVFDCDKENRRLLYKGHKGYRRVVKAFPEALGENGLDKAKLSRIVFSNETKRLQLESIMHPLILEELSKRSDDPLIAEVPLLFEVNWDRYFDLNVLIVADEKQVYDRLLLRGLDDQQIRGRIAAQMDVEEKIKRADKIIYNNGSLSELYEAADQLLKEVL
ncbi:MAG: dephospho-CoA kinase [Erysipelotrichaceae bacterium]|nr:dephospho-CoA kinase [Erysipelotrichaceae bacterium]